MGDEYYFIDPDRCTECVGHFDVPQCAQLCPVGCIPVNPQRVESRPQLWAKYRRLVEACGGTASPPAPAADTTA